MGRCDLQAPVRWWPVGCSAVATQTGARPPPPSKHPAPHCHTLQPCITKRVLLRGCFQTVPLSLYGYSLEAAAAAAPPPVQRVITPAGALQWLRQQRERGAGYSGAPEAGAGAWGQAALQPAAEAALAQLAAYWERVGTSERLMALHPLPAAVFKAAAAVADAICAQLAAGSFGHEPLLAAPAQAKENAAAQQQQAQQQQAQAQPPQVQAQEPQQAVEQAEQQEQRGGDEPPGTSDAADGSGDAEMPDAGELQQQAEEQPAQAQAQQVQQAAAPRLLCGEALLEAAADMVLGWCGMLGAGATARTASAVRCSAAGLAAAVLLCSCAAGVRLVVARWGAVLLDDVLTMPGVRRTVLPAGVEAHGWMPLCAHLTSPRSATPPCRPRPRSFAMPRPAAC